MTIDEYIRRKNIGIMNKTGEVASEIDRRCGHSKSYIGNILSGNSLPRFDSLVKICRFAQISLSDFFIEYEPCKSEILAEIKRLFAREEEEQFCDILKRADRESVLIFQVIDQDTDQSLSNKRCV